jgi:hypothetical protein
MTGLELRAADPQQRAMLDTYLDEAYYALTSAHL